MVQAELNSSTLKGNGLIITRKVYTKEYVDKKCKIWVKSRQLGFDGSPFCLYKHLEEIEWVKCAILDALNNPETFNAGDNYAALCNLKDLIKGSKAEKLRSKYAVPVKLEYRNAKGVNCIVDVNHGDKLVVPLTSGELLDVIADLIRPGSVNIFQALQILCKNNSEIEELLKDYLDYNLPEMVEVNSDNTYITINYPGGLNQKMLTMLNITQKDIEFQTYRDSRGNGVECIYYLKWEHVLQYDNYK